MKREESLSSSSIKFALEDHEEVLCKFELHTHSSGDYSLGFIHLALPNHMFLVSDAHTQIAYVVSFKDIKYIEYE